MQRFDNVEIPYGAYWSTPFAKWQGSLQHLHSIRFAAHVAKAELASRNIATEHFDFGALGITIAQHQSFYGVVGPMFEIGMKTVTGPTISQACATGQRLLQTLATEVQLGYANACLALGVDRLSNGPHIYYPAPGATGGVGVAEAQTTHNFSHDVIGGHPMLQTAENVARKHGISMTEQHELVLRRYAQYQDALKDEQRFQKRYMTLPFAVPTANFKTVAGTLSGDEGIVSTTPAGLAKLKPVLPEGTVTYGAQTHPADGHCGLIVTTPAQAQALSSEPRIRVRVLSFGQARADLAFMPEAPVPATERALRNAGVSMAQIKAVKSHNPFAVNDIVFAKSTGFDLARMNNYGCSLIYGHPHAATGLRGIIELIEELVVLGGGLGVFQGCAAGDSAMAVVLEVSER